MTCVTIKGQEVKEEGLAMRRGKIGKPLIGERKRETRTFRLDCDLEQWYEGLSNKSQVVNQALKNYRDAQVESQELKHEQRAVERELLWAYRASMGGGRDED